MVLTPATIFNMPRVCPPPLKLVLDMCSLLNNVYVASSPGHSHLFNVAPFLRATLKMWEWPGDEAIINACMHIIICLWLPMFTWLHILDEIARAA